MEAGAGRRGQAVKGILVWDGEAGAAERMAAFAAEMDQAGKGCFTGICCAYLGRKTPEAEEGLLEWGASIQNLVGEGCPVVLELWEVPGNLAVSVLGNVVRRRLEGVGPAVQVFYGSLQGRQIGSYAAALQGRECMMDAVHVGSRDAEGGKIFYAERKACSGHLNCRARFVPEKAVLVLSQEGEKAELFCPGVTREKRVGAFQKECLEKRKPECGSGILVREWQGICDSAALDSGVEILGDSPKETGEDLQTAKVVFVGGKGLRTKENFQRLRMLAKRMGAACGCTRPVAMAGWADFSRVVGISGNRLQAEVCVAFGVSGSAAFLCGTEAAKHLVAVNNDKNAPIFLRAETGILDDCMAIVEALENREG